MPASSLMQPPLVRLRTVSRASSMGVLHGLFMHAYALHAGTCAQAMGPPAPRAAAMQREDATPQRAAPPPAVLVPASAHGILAEKQQGGWSPSKIASLNFFLSSTAKPPPPPTAAVVGGGPPLALLPPPSGEAAPAPSVGAAIAPSSSAAIEPQRPYLGLKYLLRSGPGGSGAPKTWADLHVEQGQPQAKLQAAKQQAAGRGAAAASGRFAPYSLPPPRASRGRYVWGRGVYLSMRGGFGIVITK